MSAATTIITVLTVLGTPSFLISPSTTARDVDRMVAARHGNQPDGRHHNWRGDSTDPEINRLAAINTRRARGLPDDASEADVRAAYDRLAAHNTRHAVGLPDDASEADVRAAYDRLAEENTARMHKGL